MIPLFDWPAQRPKYFKNYVTKNLEQFQDTSDLAEDFGSPILPTQRPRLFQYSKGDPMLMTKIFLKIDASNKGHFKVFPKENEEFS